MMGLGTMIFLVVLVAAISGVMSERYKALGKSGGAKLDDAERRALEDDRNAARRELDELRERVKVLERITTDSHTADARERRRIADEIESLRDS